ncbi:MAG: hypothetical protein L0216_09430 [Planctomycetales bacterium]|nr:hypothetical protein [Planctomycetales bacterium]
MIRVNLLPPEYRVKERTSLPRLLGVMGAAGLAAAAMVAFLAVHVVWLKREESLLQQKKEEEKLQAQRAKEHDRLQAQIEKFKKRNQRIEEIKEEHPKWAPLLKEWVDVVQAGELQTAQQPYKSWFTTFDLKEVKGPGGKPGAAKKGLPEISMKGYIQRDDGRHFSAFLRKFADTPFFADWKTTDQGYKVEPFEKYTPDKAMSFTMAATQEPPPPPPKLGAPGAPGAGGGTAPAPAGGGAGAAPPAAGGPAGGKAG